MVLKILRAPLKSVLLLQKGLLPSFFPELRLLTKSPSHWRRAGTPPCWQAKMKMVKRKMALIRLDHCGYRRYLYHQGNEQTTGGTVEA